MIGTSSALKAVKREFMQTESQPQKSSGGALERMALPLLLLLAAMHLPLVLQLAQRRAEAFWSLNLLIPFVSSG